MTDDGRLWANLQFNSSYANRRLSESGQCPLDFLEYRQAEGNEVKHFGWVTYFAVTLNNACQIMRCGRARWKVENETFNTLKNLGYHLERNYGPGSRNLSTNFILLMTLAFLVDQTRSSSIRADSRSDQAMSARLRLKKMSYLTLHQYLLLMAAAACEVIT
jgi:hypothetical protein